MSIRKLALRLIVPAAALATALFGVSTASAASIPVEGATSTIAATTAGEPALQTLGLAATEFDQGAVTLVQWGPRWRYYRRPPPRWRYYRRPAPRYYRPGAGWNRHVRWCLNRYRSYSPATNQYLGFDGYYHRCRSPWR